MFWVPEAFAIYKQKTHALSRLCICGPADLQGVSAVSMRNEDSITQTTVILMPV